MTDSIDPVRLQDLLDRISGELVVARLVLAEIGGIVLANGSAAQREAWIDGLRTVLTDAASALAADPAEPEGVRRRAETIESSAHVQMDLLRVAMDRQLEGR